MMRGCSTLQHPAIDAISILDTVHLVMRKTKMSQTETTPEPFDGLDGLIGAMYRSVSGPRGAIDARLQGLVFTPQARLIRTGVGEDGEIWRKEMSVADYEESTREFFASRDFYEYETARQIKECAPFAYVLSEYEAKGHPESDEIILRGVNSIQCFFDGQRWWVNHLIWNHHR
jgi:hypothetical protein